MPSGFPENFLTGPVHFIRMVPRSRLGLPSWVFAILLVTLMGCWFPLFGEPVSLSAAENKSEGKPGEFLDESSIQILLQGSAREAAKPEPLASPEKVVEAPDPLAGLVDGVNPGDLDEDMEWKDGEESVGGETWDNPMEILMDVGLTAEVESAGPGDRKDSAEEVPSEVASGQ